MNCNLWLHEFSLSLNELRVSRVNCKPTACIAAIMRTKSAIHERPALHFTPLNGYGDFRA